MTADGEEDCHNDDVALLDDSGVEIRPGRMDDADGLLALHRAVAEDTQGLIRQPEEITADYIHDTLTTSIDRGMIFVATRKMTSSSGGVVVVGEIHAHAPPLVAFRHLLADLVVAVHPDVQGRGVGRRLFDAFLRLVPPHVARVELYTRETNIRNVQFYKRLGFASEGRQRHKICTPRGELQTPLLMAWLNPNFDVSATMPPAVDSTESSSS